MEEKPNGLKILTALHVLQSHFIISPVLYDENGDNVIPRSVLFHRNISHKLILMQELTIMFLH